MPENKDLPIVDFPETIRFGEKPITEFYNSENSIRVVTIQEPPKNYKEICYRMVEATWQDKPTTEIELLRNKEKIEQTFLDLLKGKVLPNSMESLNFTFMIEGLTHIEWSHILRHREGFSGWHFECTGDRFLTNDSVFIPSSIDKSKFADKYKKISIDAKKLYQEMVDSKEISLMDARYILTRNHRYFIYVTINLKAIIGFIRQRSCEAVQPETDNILAHKIYEQVIKSIPEISQVIDFRCRANCPFIVSPLNRNTRLYLPNKNHRELFEYNPDNYLYKKTRKEMGVWFNKQDE